MASLSEPVPETSTGTIEEVSQGQAKWLDASFSSSASQCQLKLSMKLDLKLLRKAGLHGYVT